MPAKSAAQQKAASRRMEDSMSEKQLEDFAHTGRKGKPDHIDD